MNSLTVTFRGSERRRFVSVVLCIALVGASSFWKASSAQQDIVQPGSLTLPRAVEIALRSNPLTRITAFGRDRAEADVREARAGRWPRLQATETFTTSNNPVFVFGSLLEQGRFGVNNFDITSLNNPDSLSNFRSSVTLTIPIFDQRETETRVAKARIGKEQADLQGDLVEQQLRFEVVHSYLGSLAAQARLVVATEAVKTAESDVKRARDMFESGLVVRSDLLAAEVQLSEFRQQKVQAIGELETNIAALNAALGLPIETPQKLLGQLKERNFDVETIDVLSQHALQDRPDYKRAILSSRTSAVQLRGTSSEWLPRVEAFVSVGASSRHLSKGSGDYAAGVNVTFNMFDAGRQARIDRARASESIAKAETEHLANQIQLEVVRAYQRYVTARERLLVMAQAAAQATETLRIVQERYHVGITTITELLRAETALVQARSAEIEARYDQYVGYANVLLATGRLKDVAPFN